MLWSMIEWLREFVAPFLLTASEPPQSWQPPREPEPEPEPEPRPEANEPMGCAEGRQIQSCEQPSLPAADSTLAAAAASIVHGEPLIDRKSVFQAHLMPCCSRDDVDIFLATLKENRKVAVATHNILACE
eukprot:SAG25_NODE_540_length_7084_cov_4.278454_7_plen_130_part_00